MRALVLATLCSVVLGLSAHRSAVAAPCLNCGESATGNPGDNGPSRALWLAWAGTVNGAITAVDVYTYATGGKRNYTVSGFGFVMSIPVMLYGVDFLQADHTDGAAWAMTLWSVAAMAHGFWPVIDSRFRSTAQEPTRVSNRRVSYRVRPTPIVTWHDRSAHAGLSLSGSF